MSKGRAILAVLFFGSLLAVAARYALPSTEPYVDGFPLEGRASACGARDRCAHQVERAKEVIDARFPGHAAVVAAAVYPPIDLRARGQTFLDGLLGPPRYLVPPPTVTVIVLTLADGSKHASGIYCPGWSGSLEPVECTEMQQFGDRPSPRPIGTPAP